MAYQQGTCMTLPRWAWYEDALSESFNKDAYFIGGIKTFIVWKQKNVLVFQYLLHLTTTLFYQFWYIFRINALIWQKNYWNTDSMISKTLDKMECLTSWYQKLRLPSLIAVEPYCISSSRSRAINYIIYSCIKTVYDAINANLVLT